MQSYKIVFLDMNSKNPHLPHLANEIEGQPPCDALTYEMACDSAGRLVRELMATETFVAERQVPAQQAA